MRVLVVTSSPPLPTSGYAIRCHHIVRSLAERHDVSVLCYCGADDGTAELAGVDLRAVPWVAPRRKRVGQAASALTARSHLGGIFHTPAMQHGIERIMEETAFDVVLVEGSLLTRFDFGTVPVVLDEHNIEHNLLRRTAAQEHSPVRRAFARLEARKFRREEIAACRRAAWCTFTSVLERDLMAADAPLSGSTVVPNGVDLEYFSPTADAGAPDSLVFTGRLDYRPNADAVVHLVRDVLPEIRRRRPGVRLTLVGGGAPPEVQRLAGDGVVLTGLVGDVRPHVRGASVVVAPLRIGAGTRLKVLEALAMARPLVSTALGCEGIDVVSGEHLLVADSPAAFADAVVRLLECPDLGASLGRRGRALVEATYGWERCGALMRSVLERVGSRHARVVA